MQAILQNLGTLYLIPIVHLLNIFEISRACMQNCEWKKCILKRKQEISIVSRMSFSVPHVDHWPDMLVQANVVVFLFKTYRKVERIVQWMSCTLSISPPPHTNTLHTYSLPNNLKISCRRMTLNEVTFNFLQFWQLPLNILGDDLWFASYLCLF